MRRAVFLDRDGVLNRSVLINGVPKPPSQIGEVAIIDGVIAAIQILMSHDFMPVVVTNQPDVARGATTRSRVESINTYIGEATNIKHFYTCFHDDSDLCKCRKPQPGLLLRAAQELNLDIYQSFLVGDRWSDISAGQAAGCQTFFIDYSYPEDQPKMPFIRVKSLFEAVSQISGEK